MCQLILHCHAALHVLHVIAHVQLGLAVTLVGAVNRKEHSTEVIMAPFLNCCNPVPSVMRKVVLSKLILQVCWVCAGKVNDRQSKICCGWCNEQCANSYRQCKANWVSWQSGMLCSTASTSTPSWCFLLCQCCVAEQHEQCGPHTENRILSLVTINVATV